MGTWYDKDGRGWRNRRPDGWLLDDRCPDGWFASGYRKIRKGRIKVFGCFWSHPTFAQNEGRFVHVISGCCWGTKCTASYGFDGASPQSFVDNPRGTIEAFYANQFPLVNLDTGKGG